MKYPRVKDILYNAELGGLQYVKNYLNQKNIKIDSSTWSGKIKKLIDEDKSISAMAEIDLLILKFNKYVRKEKNTGGSDDCINSIGNKENK